MESMLEIPIFPLGSVLYPAGRLPLRIFEPRYVEMTRSCIRDRSLFGVALIKAGYEVGKPAVPCDVGCTARILQWQEPESGRFTLMAQGESVFRILQRRVMPDGLIVAQIELDEPPDPAPVPEQYVPLRNLLTDLMEQIGAEHFPQPQRLDDAAWLGNRLCELLPVEPERKQKLLEMRDPLAVLGELEQMLKRLREGGRD
jgi:Lon protease-like protein